MRLGWVYWRWLWGIVVLMCVSDLLRDAREGRLFCAMTGTCLERKWQGFSGVEAVWTKFDLVRPFDGWGSNGTTPFIKISGYPFTAHGPNLTTSASFGSSVVSIGDLDGDGVQDIAVGACGESAHRNGTEYVNAGAVYILFMHHNGSVKHTVRIAGNDSSSTNASEWTSVGGPTLYANDEFGYSLASIGDLDGDGISELAVGAPGYIVSSVYILFLAPSGRVRRWRLIRGEFVGTVPLSVNASAASTSTSANSSYVANGPAISYGCRFGTALTALGDINNDTIPDLAVSAVNSFAASTDVYLLRLDALATVLTFTHIGPGVGGVPVLSRAYSGYGSALRALPALSVAQHINSTRYQMPFPVLAVGANLLYEAGSVHEGAGEVFLHVLNESALVRNSTQLSETSSSLRGADKILPQVTKDACGSSLAYIGDINRDDYRQRHPNELSPKPDRESVPDLVVGCPQTQSNGLPGRLFFLFLDKDGSIAGQRSLPDVDVDSFDRTGLSLKPYDRFAQSLDGYVDIDGNGLREILVGAPGDDSVASNGGAVYILFPRRRRPHPKPYDWWTLYAIVTVIPCVCCSMCISGILAFCWYFRRIPDEVEIIVKQSGLEIDPRKGRPKYQKPTNQVYCDNYYA